MRYVQSRKVQSSQRVTAIGAREALAIGVAVAVLAVLGLALAEAFDVTLLLEPEEAISPGGLAAWIGVGLLVVDIVLPVPSSVVMLAHGALFGVVPGAALSLLGRTGNAAVGVLLGRSAGGLLSRRTVRRPPSVQTRGADLVRRWGLAAVVLTRPIPVLAESTLVAAAAMGVPPAGVIVAAVVGALPEAVLYAVAGVDAVVAKLLATLVSMTAAYVGHRYWSFAHRARTGVRREYLLFAAVNGVTLCMGLAIVAIVRYPLGQESALVLQAANIGSICLGTVIRYLSYRTWVFPARRSDSLPAAPVAPAAATASAQL